MAGKLLQQFLQSATIGTREIPREAIFSLSYIEKASLRAPLLVLKVHDTAGKIVDDFKAQYGATLVADIGDPTGKNDSYKETFFITSAKGAGDVVTIVAASADLTRLKTPSARSWLYTNRQPVDIIKAHSAKMTLNVDSLKRACTYHLNVGEKPSKVLSQMAHDRAALVWVARGAFNFKGMDTILSGKISFEYEAYNPQAEFTIMRMTNINQDHALVAKTEYRFIAYSPTEGYLSFGDPSLPVKHISDSDLETLKNMQRIMVPKLDVEVAGNPAITAGMVIGITIHRMDKENQVSEALPKKFVVMKVAHNEGREAYITRMILGVPNSV